MTVIVLAILVTAGAIIVMLGAIEKQLIRIADVIERKGDNVRVRL